MLTILHRTEINVPMTFLDPGFHYKVMSWSQPPCLFMALSLDRIGSAERGEGAVRDEITPATAFISH